MHICANRRRNSDCMKSDYLEYLRRVRRYSERTCEIYSGVLDEYLAFASCPEGADPVPYLDFQIMRSYEVYLLDERKDSPRTVSLHLSVLSGFCRFLMKKGLMTSNPARLVKKPVQEKRLPEFFREEAMEEYFRSTMGVMEYGSFERKLNRMIISILYNTGIRRGELVSLRRDSVDFSRHVLRVKGKGDKIREIPLLPSLCEEISLYLQSQDSLKYADTSSRAPLLQTPKGAPLYPMFIQRAVRAELGDVEGIGGRKSPHVLRHTLATGLLDNGADLNSIKELLGHSSLAATQVYTHNSIEKLRKVYNNAHPRAKNGGNMEIRIKALKFDADEKLVQFVEKKTARLSKFFDGAAHEAEVSLEDIKEGKRAKIQIGVPGDTLIIERVADTFENAITECVDAMKEKLTRAKEKKYEK